MGVENRTTMELPMRAIPVDEVLQIVGKHLEPAGFSVKLIDGEQAWSKGDAVMTLMFCVKAAFTGHSVIIQGWTKDAVLGEGKLEGFMGALPKRKVKKLLNRITEEIQERDAALAANMSYGGVEQGNFYGEVAPLSYDPNIGGYGESDRGYGWPNPGGTGYEGRPAVEYGAPMPVDRAYAGAPADGYGAPMPVDRAYAGAPADGYGAPMPVDRAYAGAPADGYGASMPIDRAYAGAPADGYGAPMPDNRYYAGMYADGYGVSDGRMEYDFVRSNEVAEAIKPSSEDSDSSRKNLSWEGNETTQNEGIVEEDIVPDNLSSKPESAALEEKRSLVHEDIEHWDGKKALVFRKSRN